MVKNKKKGFTLIELLAVIVVLAILALIAVPIVLNIIKDARNNSNKRSIESYVRAIDYAVSEYMSENPDQEVVTWEDVKDKVEYKGKVECQWGENLSSISSTGEITLHGCKVNNKTNSLYGYVDGKVVEEENGKYKKYSVGDEITYNGIKFYVISPSDTKQDYVTLLKDEPLTVEEVNTYGVGHINRYTYDSVGTAYNFNGYGGMAYYSSPTCGYVNSSWVNDGCTTNYDESEIKKVVEAWKDAKLTENELKEVNEYKARLITYEDLYNNLDYEVYINGTTILRRPSESTPSWVYNSNYWYWTMSPYNDSAYRVWNVYGNGNLDHDNVSNSYGGGVVRPVINLLKSAI